MGASRFRPLAGFWFLNIDRFRMFARAASVFPSPCGVLVLKCEYYHANNTEENRFRPLAGFPILASPVATGEVASNASRWGRSWLACTSVAMKVYSLRPWRPLHRLRGPPADLSKKQALGRS